MRMGKPKIYTVYSGRGELTSEDSPVDMHCHLNSHTGERSTMLPCAVLNFHFHEFEEKELLRADFQVPDSCDVLKHLLDRCIY